MTTRKPRILFFPLDSRGMGHLSRICKLAWSVQDIAACVIATGFRHAGNLVPKNCEYIRIPGFEGLIEERAAEYGRRPIIDLPFEEGLAMRRELLQKIERMLAPDAIVTDLFPVGFYNELKPILEQSRAAKFIVFRPAPGDIAIRAMEEIGLAPLRGLYDEFLIASEPGISTVEEDFHFTPLESSRCRYIGYVSIPVSNAEIETARARRGLGARDRWVVCSAGSGFYRHDLIKDCLGLAAAFPDAHFDVVAGPDGPPVGNLASPGLFAGGRVRVEMERADLRIIHAAADVVVCHGGYNTLTEAMEGGAAIIVDTRSDQYHERFRHATRLNPRYPILTASGAIEIAGQLRALLSSGLDRRPVRGSSSLNFRGGAEFAAIISARLQI